MKKVLAAAVALVSSSSVAGPPPAAEAGQVGMARPERCFGLQLQQVITGLPPGGVGAITHAGDRSGRLFIVMLSGRVLIWTGSGTNVLPTPFLNIEPIVAAGGERGLLGLAFHPDYAQNGYFYVYYTRESDTSAHHGDIVIARYSRSAADPNVADPASAAQMLVIEHETFSNHNGGQLAFGPDGYLYALVGDGGSGNDPYESGQALDTCGGGPFTGTPAVPCYLGKLLRLDVNQNVDTPPYYGIPATNPFQSGGPQTCGPAFPGSTCDEIWAYGLRNPWRASFDRVTGDLFIADVGQGQREEVNMQAAGGAGGQNYGWDVLEGTRCMPTEDNPAGTCNAFLGGASVLPIIEYDRSGPAGCRAVIGGYRYRGRAYPAFHGVYVYADACTGQIWGAAPAGATAKRRSAWSSMQLIDTDNLFFHTFGEDEAGELYLGHGGATIFRLVVTSGCN